MEEIQISQTACYLPPKVVTNDDLAKIMDTSDEWIASRTGIRKRHISSGENTSVLAARVAHRLLHNAGVKAAAVDLLVVATMSPDAYTPSTAAIVQGRINAVNAVAFDISAACTGFVYALQVASQMLSGNPHWHRAIVIGAEVLSKLVDWHDRSTAVLFGDGAGGVLLEKKPGTASAILGSRLCTYGCFSDQIVAGQTKAGPLFPGPVTTVAPFQMDGRAVYKFATHRVPESIRQAAEGAGLELDDIDYFILHQANARIIKQVARRLSQPLAKFPVNIDHVGNTSAASEPILLAELVAKQQLHRGDLLALSGFGGGLTTGTMIIKY